MNDPTRQDDFEVYPYAQPEPPPAEEQVPRSALEQPPTVRRAGPETFGRPAGVDRRGLIFGVVGVGLAGLVGASIFRAGSTGPVYPESEWSEGPVPVDEAPIDETVFVVLQTIEGDLGLDVPTSWEVLREGELVHLQNLGEGSELVARVPEPPVRTGEAQLRLEAEYTRARFQSEFVPDGDAVVERAGDDPYEQLSLTSTGTADAAAAREQVTYLVDTDRERGLVVAVQVSDAAVPGTAEAAQRMVDQLVEGFRSL